MTYFCLGCFHEVPFSADTCPSCGADLRAIDRESLEARMIRALDHRLPDVRIVAANALGTIRSASAQERLIALADEDPDPYVAAACIRALAHLHGERATAVVERIARSGPAIARRTAREELDARRAARP